VKSGTIFDNVLFTDDPEYAKTAAATAKATQEGEKKVKDAQDEEERKTAEAESKTEEKDEDNEDLGEKMLTL
jgi:calreticulin